MASNVTRRRVIIQMATYANRKLVELDNALAARGLTMDDWNRWTEGIRMMHAGYLASVDCLAIALGDECNNISLAGNRYTAERLAKGEIDPRKIPLRRA